MRIHVSVPFILAVAYESFFREENLCCSATDNIDASDLNYYTFCSFSRDGYLFGQSCYVWDLSVVIVAGDSGSLCEDPPGPVGGPRDPGERGEIL